MSDYRVQIYRTQDDDTVCRYRWSITEGEPVPWDTERDMRYSCGCPMVRNDVASGYTTTLRGARRQVRRALVGLRGIALPVNLAEGMEW